MESETRQESAGVSTMGLWTHRLDLSMENTMPQDTILGLSKNFMRTSGLKYFRTLSSNRALRPSSAGHSFPDSDWILCPFYISLAMGIQVTRYSCKRMKLGKFTEELRLELVKIKLKKK